VERASTTYPPTAGLPPCCSRPQNGTCHHRCAAVVVVVPLCLCLSTCVLPLSSGLSLVALSPPMFTTIHPSLAALTRSLTASVSLPLSDCVPGLLLPTGDGKQRARGGDSGGRPPFHCCDTPSPPHLLDPPSRHHCAHTRGEQCCPSSLARCLAALASAAAAVAFPFPPFVPLLLHLLYLPLTSPRSSLPPHPPAAINAVDRARRRASGGTRAGGCVRRSRPAGVCGWQERQ